MKNTNVKEGDKVIVKATGLYTTVRKVVKASYLCFYLHGEDGCYRIESDILKVNVFDELGSDISRIVDVKVLGNEVKVYDEFDQDITKRVEVRFARVRDNV